MFLTRKALKQRIAELEQKLTEGDALLSEKEAEIATLTEEGNALKASVDAYTAREEEIASLKQAAEETLASAGADAAQTRTEAEAYAADVRAEAEAYAATARADADEYAARTRADIDTQSRTVMDAANYRARQLEEEADGKAAAVLADADREAEGTRNAATMQADTLVSEAGREADATVAAARASAEEMVSAARKEAEEIVSSARHEASRMLLNAEASVQEYEQTIEAYNAQLADTARMAQQQAERLAAFSRTGRVTAPNLAEEAQGISALPLSDGVELEDAGDDPALVMQNIYRLQHRTRPDEEPAEEEEAKPVPPPRRTGAGLGALFPQEIGGAEPAFERTVPAEPELTEEDLEPLPTVGSVTGTAPDMDSAPIDDLIDDIISAVRQDH